MASTKKKAVVSKDDLRRLMKEKQTLLKPEKKRIDSPLARYNALGQLSCVLCNAPVKNELLWNAHIIGRTHKEALAVNEKLSQGRTILMPDGFFKQMFTEKGSIYLPKRLKAEKEMKERAIVPPPEPPDQKKRKLADEEILAMARGLKPLPDKHKKKKLKDSLSSETIEVVKSEEKKPRSILKTSATYQQQQTTSVLGGEESSQSLEHDEDEDKDIKPAATLAKVTPEPGLPPDFFDPDVVSDAPADDSTKKMLGEMSDQLPEGFFDDPKQDAKIRKVEYKDKLDEEWEIFQRVINEETHTSEVIQAEDDEVANEERHLVEVEEQLKKWSKIDQLAKKKEKLMAHEKESIKKQNSDDEDSVDEQEFDEFLDWRSKKAWK